MRYNDNDIEIEVVTDVARYPVDRDSVKAALGLQFDTDGSYVFNDDDDKIDEIIKAACETLENYTGLSFAPKTLKAVVRNELGGVEIPAGPHINIISITDEDGEPVTNYKLRGNRFIRIESPCSCYLLVEFTAGYEEGRLPHQLKRAIVEECVFRYSNAGDQQQEYAVANVALCESSLNLAAPFKRKSILA